MAGTHRILRFRIGDEYYCLSVQEAAQVKRVDDPRTVPNSPDFSAGVIEPEDTDTAVELLDPGEAFDIRGDRDDTQFGIVLSDDYRENDRRLGWLVDEVLTVEEIQRDEVDESVKEIGVVGGVEFENAEDDMEMAIWLDPAVLFDEETDYVTGPVEGDD